MSNIQGKICICTGAIESSKTLSQQLIDLGADAHIFPMIEVNHLILPKDFTNAIDKISSYKWLMFTSKNGVHSFFSLLKEYKGSYALPNGIKIASIGIITSKVIESYKHKINFTCTKNNGKDFAQELSNFIGSAKATVLFPTGNLTQNMIALSTPDNISIDKIITYKTEPPKHFDNKIAEAIKNNSYNHIIFTSPSGVRNFMNLFKDVVDLNKLKAVSIGPASSKQLADLGIKPEITAEIHNNDGIVEALQKHYS